MASGGAEVTRSRRSIYAAISHCPGAADSDGLQTCCQVQTQIDPSGAIFAHDGWAVRDDHFKRVLLQEEKVPPGMGCIPSGAFSMGSTYDLARPMQTPRIECARWQGRPSGGARLPVRCHSLIGIGPIAMGAGQVRRSSSTRKALTAATIPTNRAFPGASIMAARICAMRAITAAIGPAPG